MIVKIDKLSHDFRGISRINDKVLFIPSVLPEEVVDVRITIDKKNYSIGKAMNHHIAMAGEPNHEDASQQNAAAQHMHQHVAEASTTRFMSRVAPY